MSSKHYITHISLFPLWVVNTYSSFILIFIIILSEDISLKKLHCIFPWISSNDVHLAVAGAFSCACFLGVVEWRVFFFFFLSYIEENSHILHNTLNFPFDTLKWIYYTWFIKSMCNRLTTPIKILLFSVRA